jgi:cytoskeletal protein RodZ
LTPTKTFPYDALQLTGILGVPLYMADFGASFKRAREAKGVSLDKIAEETRISTRFLLAIEKEEFHLLPGGIFNRGFVRTFADRVGLDPDQAVADYERLTEYREQEEPVRAATKESSRIERNLYIGAAGALVLLIAIYYLVTRNSGTPAGFMSQPASTVTQAATPPPQPPLANEPTPEQSPTSPAEQEPPAAAEQNPAPAAKELSIEVEALETTWVKLITDGTTVTEELLQPGMIRRYTAAASIDITIGNAGGLMLTVNGQPVRRPLGRSGQVRQFVITPQNVNEFIG